MEVVLALAPCPHSALERGTHTLGGVQVPDVAVLVWVGSNHPQLPPGDPPFPSGPPVMLWGGGLPEGHSCQHI